MVANPHLPTTSNGKRRLINQASFPALTDPVQLAGAQNALALLLPKWRTAVAKVKAGTANATLLFVGDSTTAGFYSAASHTPGIDEVTNAYPSQVARMLTTSGLNTQYQSFLGFTQTVYDARFSLGTAFSIDGSQTVAGGGSLKATSGTVSPATFTPATPVDTFVIWYMQHVNASVFSYAVNGGTPVNQSVNGTVALQSLTVTVPKGINTLELRYVSGPNVWLVGLYAYDSSSKFVNAVRAGWSGSTTTQWNVSTNPWSPKNISGYSPDLTVLSLGINDWNAVASLGLYKSNMQALITEAKTTGDVVIMTPPPSLLGSGSAPDLVSQAQYVSVLLNLAKANNVPVVDVYNRFVSYTLSSALYGDAGTHPNGPGYADMAQAVFNVIGNP